MTRSAPPTLSSTLRDQLADEAARIMVESGIRDFELAKRKAADRLGVSGRSALPANREIASALEAHRRLFSTAEDVERQTEMRRSALLVMRRLAEFQPRLVGSVLEGTADAHSPIELHVFAETAEELCWFMFDERVPHRVSERRVRLGRGTHERVPAIEAEFGGIEIEILVFAGRQRRMVPTCLATGRTVQRASVKQLESLLGAGASQASPAETRAD